MFRGVQRCPEVSRGVKKCPEVSRGIQMRPEVSELSIAVHNCPVLSIVFQCCSAVYRVIQSYLKVKHLRCIERSEQSETMRSCKSVGLHWSTDQV